MRGSEPSGFWFAAFFALNLLVTLLLLSLWLPSARCDELMGYGICFVPQLSNICLARAYLRRRAQRDASRQLALAVVLLPAAPMLAFLWL